MSVMKVSVGKVHKRNKIFDSLPLCSSLGSDIAWCPKDFMLSVLAKHTGACAGSRKSQDSPYRVHLMRVVHMTATSVQQTAYGVI